jgi:hypothetical protein
MPESDTYGGVQPRALGKGQVLLKYGGVDDHDGRSAFDHSVIMLHMLIVCPAVRGREASSAP